MTTFQKQFLWVLVTLIIAVITPLSIDLLDATINWRTMTAHILASIAVTMGALLAKFPQKIWTDEERAVKLADKEGGFYYTYFAVLLFALTAVACTALGLQKPETTGQTLVQSYVNATASAALIPTVLSDPPLISSRDAQTTLDASRTVHDGIDAYWDAAGLLDCKTAKPDNAVLVEKCQGGNPQAVVAAINQSLLVVTKFILRYQGVKR